MSEFDSNPFAEPANDNPFHDPSVTQVTNSTMGSVEQFNPFPAHPTESLAATTPASTSPYQPAVLQPSTEPSPQATAVAAQANLLRQQEELERKAAELDRREQELQSRGPTGKENNWPPLPKNFPIKPCFYQDFSEDIPEEHRRICKMIYYLWMFNCVTLFLNLLACLALFTTGSSGSGVDFGLSILWVILFTPCSFLCWYRPVYKAFKSDSSFSFFFFFMVFFCQVVIFIIQSVGIPNWGNSGWITAFSAMSSNTAVGAIMMVVAIFFTICSILSIVLLKMVHRNYRRTGASFQKAQQEFSQGVFTNKTFQSAASTAAASAAQGAFQGNN